MRRRGSARETQTYRPPPIGGLALFGWRMVAGGLFGAPESDRMREPIAELQPHEPTGRP